MRTLSDRAHDPWRVRDARTAPGSSPEALASLICRTVADVEPDTPDDRTDHDYPPDASIAEAARTPTEEDIGSLLVVEDRIEGIVTTTDLALYLPQYRVNMATQSEPETGKGKGEFE